MGCDTSVMLYHYCSSSSWVVLVGLQVLGLKINEQVQPLGCVPLCTFAPLCAVLGADCCGLEVVGKVPK